MKDKLILSLTSPYARKVRIVALEKGLDFDVLVDVPWNEDTGVIRLNPLGKVPVWVTPELGAIFDSRVIVDYLETVSAPALLPSAAIDRIRVKQIEALADGVMDASLCLFAERKKRPKELQHAWWIDRQFGKLHRGLQELSQRLGDQEFFWGHQISVADIAVASALGYVGLRFSDDFNWEQSYPVLSRFYARMMTRESVQSTVPVV